VSRPRDRVGVFDPARPERSESLTPHVTSRRLAWHPKFVCECQNPLPHAPPRARLHEPEAPSTNRFHRFARLSPTYHCVDRHWYRWLVANDPASDMRSRPNPRSARPNCLPAIHRGRKATCRLSASATYCCASTPSPCPTSGGEAANHFPPDGDVPFGSSPTELPQVRGHLACFTASTPTARDRSLRRIYPNLTGSSTLCHETVPH
jgi:hypothetical protein